MSCIVCQELAILKRRGYSYCREHSKYAVLDPEELETVVLMRFKGSTVKDIENKLNKMLRLYDKPERQNLNPYNL
jgi:hypothetical protein